ncbi:hypothetical protein AYJ56_03635 [Brucella anthropi]|nr:hypothetical protein AYJ56_03635 [Brucella anthropi]
MQNIPTCDGWSSGRSAEHAFELKFCIWLILWPDSETYSYLRVRVIKLDFYIVDALALTIGQRGWLAENSFALDKAPHEPAFGYGLVELIFITDREFDIVIGCQDETVCLTGGCIKQDIVLLSKNDFPHSILLKFDENERGAELPVGADLKNIEMNT